MIFVHELGHFLAGKWRGAYIDRFQIWFGKPIWSKKIRGVEWGVGWIPAGGFVSLPQLEGMESIEGKSDLPKDIKPLTAKDKVNLRTIPSVEREDSRVIAQLKKGDTATCIGISDNGWAKLDYKGTICYAVNSYLVKVAGDSDEPIPTEQHSSDINEMETKFEEINDRVTPKVEVNLRRLPSVEDPRAVVVASIKNGEIVQRTGINRDVGWSRVIYNGEILYCVSSYVKVVSE